MKLLSLTVNKNDTTSFYRANGVFHDLKKQMDIDITSMDFRQLNDMSWATLFLYDAVFMQRPYQAVAVQLAQYCREIGLPLWMDYDDNLFEVPIDNPGYDIWAAPAIQKNMNSLIQIADVVSVSTHGLKQAFEKLNKNIQVIPNAFNADLFSYRNNPKTNKNMLWRGSNTHNVDLMMYLDEIHHCTQKYTDWTFTFFGYNPYFLPHTPNRKYIKSTDPIYYFRQLYKLAPRAMFVPLVNSVFNRCKSNIAWIEATFAGAVCLAPKWEEWNMPGAITYENNAEFLEKMELILNEKVNFKKYNTLSWEFIMEELRLDKINRQRVKLIESLVTQPVSFLKVVK